MRAFKVFIFGLLYGWVFKIAFDRIYRENDMEDIHNENRSLREYIRSLEAQLESRALEGRAMQRMDAQAQAEPKAIPTPAPEMVSEPATPPPGNEDVPVPPTTFGATEELEDDLKIIKGIGPAIERKLNNAGIYTFAALSQLSPKQLEEILGTQVRRLQDENDIIMQAVRIVQNTPR